MKNIRKLSFTIASVLTIISNAQAKPYIKLGIGTNMLQDYSIQENGVNYNMDGGTAVDLYGSMGFYLKNIALDFGLSRTEVESNINLINVEDEIYSANFNALYSFRKNKKFTILVGGGFGYSLINSNMTFSSYSDSDKSTNFNYQLASSLEIDLTETWSLTIDSSYTLIPNVDNTANIAGTNLSYVRDLELIKFGVGIKKQF